MSRTTTTVLISGASVAGPTLAYWLARYGFAVTVVERTPAPRVGLGGHAVDLAGPAMEIIERMGLLEPVTAARTDIRTVSFFRPHKPAIDVDPALVFAAVSDRHVEVMRGELARILLEASRDSVEYVFGDSIAGLHETAGAVEVTFENSAPRSFDLVVGADGLHSNVRRLAFGPEEGFRRFLGGYLAVATLPNYLGLDDRMLMLSDVDKIVGVYLVRQTGDLRAIFLFRRADEFAYDHRDLAQQKRLLQQTFTDGHGELPRLLAEVDRAEDFYFDSISQIRTPSWARGRVALVGDAGYSPGPAVGGGTTLAVAASYVLAGELAAAGGDHVVGFRAYENEIRTAVDAFQAVGPTSMRRLVPRSRGQVWLTAQFARLLPAIPTRLLRRLSSGEGRFAGTLSRISVKDYAARSAPREAAAE